MGGWARLPTTWASARGLQLRLELMEAILTPPQLLRVDVSALDLTGSCLDSPVALCFGPSPPGHLLVSTSSNTIAVLDSRSGRVVREVSSGRGWRPGPLPPGSGLAARSTRCGVALGCLLRPGGGALGRAPRPAVLGAPTFPRSKCAFPQLSCGRPAACASLALSADGRFLLTAAERAVRLWDYAVQAGPSCQVCVPGWGHRVEDSPRCPGLTLREGHSSGLCDTTAPGVHWPLGASAGRGLHPRPAAAPQRGRRHLPLGHPGSP